MSRLGKLAINIPNEVTVKFEDNILTVKGPKGELKETIPSLVKLDISETEVKVSVLDKSKKARSFWGLFRALINNMIIGTTEGFEKKLEINGVGYRASLAGKTLKLNLGYSHPIDFELPAQVEAKVEGNTILLSSFDKTLLGDTAYKIRSFRPPEPYKGKGIKYSDEVIRKKAGKTAAKEAK